MKGIIVFENDRVTINPGSSKSTFQPITAYAIDNLYRISQSEFELRSRIPHQLCLVHRVQEYGFEEPCRDHTRNYDNDMK